VRFGQSVAAAGAAEGNREAALDELAEVAGEDRRTADLACPLLLAIVGGEPSDVTPVRKHVAADGGFAAANRISAAARRSQSGRQRGVDGEVSERSLRNGQIMAFWPGQRTRGAGRGLCRLERMRKRWRAGHTQGCSLSLPDKQNGNPRIVLLPSVQMLYSALRGAKAGE